MPWHNTLTNKLRLLKQKVAVPLSVAWGHLLYHITIARDAWKQQNAREAVATPEGKEREFLPALLEIQETPASPAGRAIGGVIILVFTLAIIWACIGSVDIVAVAQGKIIPSEHTKVIQPLEAGVITAIHVHNGQQVKKGDLLIELDATVSGADEARVTNEHLAAKVEASRLRALLAGKDKMDAPEGADKTVIVLQQRRLTDQLAEQKARLQSAQHQITQRKATVKATQSALTGLNQTLPLMEERVTAIKKMADKQYVARVQYLQIEEEWITKKQERAVLQQQLKRDKAALEEAAQQYQAIASEIKKTRLAELTDAETRAKSLSEEVIKAASRRGYQKLTAPIDGVVQQLAVHTLGGVVTSAQSLMVVVPKEGKLEVEAWVENKDIGFVNADQKAEVKVEAFPFTRYGTVDGKILSLSLDAVPLENVGHVYAARVSMDRTTMQVENKTVSLVPGMNVTVEIKTGKRRLIEYFLSPLLRGFNESVRER